MKELSKRERGVLELLYKNRPHTFTPDDIKGAGFKEPIVVLEKLRKRGLLTVEGLRYKYRDFE